MATNITGRVQLQHTSKFFVSKHKVLTEHLPVNTLLTTKIIRYKRLSQLQNKTVTDEDSWVSSRLPAGSFLRSTFRLRQNESAPLSRCGYF